MKKIQLIWIILFFSNIIFAQNTTTKAFALGADVSWLTEMEAAGRKFYNNAGQQQDAIEILKNLGMNTIRLRVWVNPVDGWCNSADMLQKAIRANNLGMKLMIDFHYSDSWADPGKQNKPLAWNTLSFADLKTAISNHTTEVLQLLKDKNIQPEWVQVGNETGNGMLWDDGKASISMSKYAQLHNAGYDAVKAVFPDTKVIVHVHNGYDNGLYIWLIGGLVANQAKFDVIGMSLYPGWSGYTWQIANQKCLTNMQDMINRYNKEVMIVESGMSWDQASVCKLFLQDLITKVKSIPNNKGLGVLYWEPQSYGQWKGYTLGAFDNTGKPTIALDAFQTGTGLIHPINSSQVFIYPDRNGAIFFSENVKSVSIYDLTGQHIFSEDKIIDKIEHLPVNKTYVIIKFTDSSGNVLHQKFFIP